jgi:two-component system response regulator FixJ
MTENGFCAFTARQMEVLRLIAEGMQGKEMAREMGCSHRTVEVHRRNLFALLEARNPAHAVAIAMRAGLIR